MRNRALQAVVVVLALVPALAIAQADEDALAGRLPADETVFYVEGNLQELLQEGRDLLAFVDPEQAEKIVFQLRELHDILREFCAGYEFRPTLLERVHEVKPYFVILAKDEPEIKVHTWQSPKWDRQTGEPIPGEFEEHSYTQRKSHTTSLILRAPDEETAANLMEELKALMDRQEVDRAEVEVERGEMFCGPDEAEPYFGRLGAYLVLSDSQPRELWAALMETPEQTVSDTPLYRRFATAERTPQALMTVNIQRLIQQTEQDLKRAVEEAEKKQAEGADDEEEEMFGGGFELMIANAAYKAFLVQKRLFSLDQCLQIGASTHVSASEDRVLQDVRGVFSHGESISAMLEEILTGSGAFHVPPVGEGERMCMMVRANPKAIYDEFLKAMATSDPGTAMAIAGGLAAMRAELGVDLGEILALAAGDAYVFIDIVEKEIDVREWNFPMEGGEEPVEPELTWRKEKATVPEVTILLGVNDAHAAGEMLSGIFTTLSGEGETSQGVGKRVYQETDVFCFGPGAAEEDTYPDGLTAFALTIVDRYVTFGSWDHVTSIIRQVKSGEGETDQELEEIIARNADANFIAVVPKAFQEKVQKTMRDGEEEANVFDALLEGLENEDFDMEDQQLAERLRNTLRELIGALKVVTEKAPPMTMATGVFTGVHRGTFYEIQATSDVSK